MKVEFTIVIYVVLQKNLLHNSRPFFSEYIHNIHFKINVNKKIRTWLVSKESSCIEIFPTIASCSQIIHCASARKSYFFVVKKKSLLQQYLYVVLPLIVFPCHCCCKSGFLLPWVHKLKKSSYQSVSASKALLHCFFCKLIVGGVSFSFST